MPMTNFNYFSGKTTKNCLTMQREIKGYWTQVSLEKLSQVTREIWELIGENSFISLSAEMGSGKTTIVRSLLKQAQIDHFEGSPTFAIVQQLYKPH